MTLHPIVRKHLLEVNEMARQHNARRAQLHHEGEMLKQHLLAQNERMRAHRERSHAENQRQQLQALRKELLTR